MLNATERTIQNLLNEINQQLIDKEPSDSLPELINATANLIQVYASNRLNLY